jgi:dipeptidyl aminopeptidase/acylaminoacyl peptidase
MSRSTIGAVALALAAMASGAHAGRPVTPDDLARIQRVGDPQVDAAGKWVAYTVGTTDVAADKGVSHIWMTSWDGARTVQLTNRPSESESSPRFSPDGHWLAFTSSRGGEPAGDSQLWLMDRAGGEARKADGIKGSVSDLAWSPDSKLIVLVVDDPDPEGDAAQTTTVTVTKPDPAVAAATPAKPDAAPPATVATAKDKPPKPIVIDRFHFKQDREGYLGKKRQRLWLYDVAAGTATRLTTGDYDESLPAWSPDGKKIAFTSNRSTDPDRGYDTNLYVVDAALKAAAPVALTTYAGEDNQPNWGSYPAWSPDGRQIAYLQGGPVKLISYGVRTLAVVPATGGPPRLLTAGLDRNVTDPIWSADGKTIRFLEEDDEAQIVAEVPAAGGPVKPVIGGWRTFSSPSAAPGGGLAVMLTTTAAPPEVYAVDPSGALRQLSHQNDTWLKELDLAPVTRTSFKSKDGTEVHGFLVTPPNAKPGAKLPTMLFNHGGPQSQISASFSLEWQIYAGHGLAVVASNFRGGTGRGLRHRHLRQVGHGRCRRRARRRGRRGRQGRRRSQPAGGRRLELRRHPDQLRHRQRQALQGRGQRRLDLQPLLRLRHRPVRQRLRDGAGPPLGASRGLDEAILPLLPERPDRHADPVHGRRQGLQRAPAEQRADVPGAEDPRRRHRPDHLSRPVPRPDAPELPQGPRPALAGLVRRPPAEIAGNLSGPSCFSEAASL